MILYLFTFLLSMQLHAEVDVEEQIRMAEDPHYLQHLREKSNEEATERTAGYEYARIRKREADEEERARREYVEWKRRQPVEDHSRDEIASLREKQKEEQEYLRLERLHAEQKFRQERELIIAQKKIFSMNRMPASTMPPRAPRKLRRFTGSAIVKLKKVVDTEPSQ